MAKLNWSDFKGPQKNFKGQGSGESIYANMAEGNNYYRVISNEFYGSLVYFAWKKYQRSADEYGSSESICPLAQEKDEDGEYFRARPNFLFKVIERSSGKVKVLRVPRQVANMMRTYATSSDWGPLTGYDICIEKGARGSNPLYMVKAIPPKPLSAEDQELIANDTLDLAKAAQPAKVDWVKEFIKRNKPQTGQSSQPARASGSAKTQAAPKQEAPQTAVDNDFELNESAGAPDDDFDSL